MRHNNYSLKTSLFCMIMGVGLLGFIYFTSAKAEKEPVESAEVTNFPNKTEKIPANIEIPVLTNQQQEQLIKHIGYNVSYNPEWLIPNWVAYELSKKETEGVVERARHFKPDPDVEGVCATTNDYKNSGYDRGHLAPAADMKWDEQAMDECFYLTNICPQNHNLNGGDWKYLEEKVRDLAVKYGHIYVACGPIVNDNPQRIGENAVVVPHYFYKVLLCKMNNQWKGIGFVFQNIAGHKPLSTYCKSIDEVEILTGIDFFPQLQDDIENEIEKHFDEKDWN